MGASLLTAGRLGAFVPEEIAVQGALRSANGAAAPDGNYSVKFALYTQATGDKAVWSEDAPQLAVQGGVFQHALGKTAALSPGLAAGGAWLGVQVGNDPELPRVALASAAFALRAKQAEGLQCSGCVKAEHVADEVLAGYAKTSDLQGLVKGSALAKVALSGQYQDLVGAPNLAEWAKSQDLAKVASSGQYADLQGKPELSSYVKSDQLAAVATSGSYADLKNLPLLPQIGKACGTGLLLRGFAADGSLDCAATVDAALLPADGLDEVSNGVLSNQFSEVRNGSKDKPIADNFAAGTADEIAFPDVGLAKKLIVTIEVSNSDVSKLMIELYGPASATPYKVYSGGSSGTSLSLKLGGDDSAVSQALRKSYLGANPKGGWSIIVRDLQANTGTTDGSFNWSVAADYVANGKVAIAGDAALQGNLAVSGTISGKWTSQNRNFVQVRAKGGQCYAAGGNFKAIDGLQLKTTTVGGSLRISAAITVQYGVSTAIRPVVDGKYPGEFGGVPWSYQFQDGVVSSGGALCGSYVQLNYDRLFAGIPAGAHTVELQVYTSGACGGNACGVIVGNGGIDGWLAAEEYY